MEISATWPLRPERHTEVAYEAMAPVYNDFTAHHDYRLMVDVRLDLGKTHGLRGARVLDVGCDTGKSFVPFLERGWKVTACDISPSMVELARVKGGPAVRIEVADMRELPVYGTFDLVCCFDDAINYLLSAAELELALRRMAANLARARNTDLRLEHADHLSRLLRRTRRGSGERQAEIWDGRSAAALPRSRREQGGPAP
jgi:SAM-dependent methyltransferase